MKFTKFVLFGFLFFGWACSGAKHTSIKHDAPPKNPNYALIYLIHGDSNYLFHKNGDAFHADKEALKEALEIASQATTGEVFIFHQKPEKRAFLLFPKKDRVFYHYKNGRLIKKQDYSPIDGGFKKEFELLKSNTSSEFQRTSLFYFGHEIPTQNDVRYHKSQPKNGFDMDIFSESLNDLPTPLDLIVLSTCNNGTPEVVDKLSGKADVLVASPQNLHLSYLNSNKVLLQEEDPSISPIALADSIAINSFKELDAFVETEITVSVYDLNTTSAYIDEFSALYHQKMNSLSLNSYGKDNLDCNDIDTYQTVINMRGVISYYSSTMFGRNSGKAKHSGWGCKQ